MGIRAALGGVQLFKNLLKHSGLYQHHDNPTFHDSTDMDVSITFFHSTLHAEVILSKTAGGTYVNEKQCMTPAIQRLVCRPG
jgi:hypothetical protein